MRDLFGNTVTEEAPAQTKRICETCIHRYGDLRSHTGYGCMLKLERMDRTQAAVRLTGTCASWEKRRA